MRDYAFLFKLFAIILLYGGSGLGSDVAESDQKKLINIENKDCAYLSTWDMSTLYQELKNSHSSNDGHVMSFLKQMTKIVSGTKNDCASNFKFDCEENCENSVLGIYKILSHYIQENPQYLGAFKVLPKLNITNKPSDSLDDADFVSMWSYVAIGEIEIHIIDKAYIWYIPVGFIKAITTIKYVNKKPVIQLDSKIEEFDSIKMQSLQQWVMTASNLYDNIKDLIKVTPLDDPNLDKIIEILKKCGCTNTNLIFPHKNLEDKIWNSKDVTQLKPKLQQVLGSTNLDTNSFLWHSLVSHSYTFLTIVFHLDMPISISGSEDRFFDTETAEILKAENGIDNFVDVSQATWDLFNTVSPPSIGKFSAQNIITERIMISCGGKSLIPPAGLYAVNLVANIDKSSSKYFVKNFVNQAWISTFASSSVPAVNKNLFYFYLVLNHEVNNVLDDLPLSLHDITADKLGTSMNYLPKGLGKITEHGKAVKTTTRGGLVGVYNTNDQWKDALLNEAFYTGSGSQFLDKLSPLDTKTFISDYKLFSHFHLLGKSFYEGLTDQTKFRNLLNTKCEAATTNTANTDHLIGFLKKEKLYLLKTETITKLLNETLNKCPRKLSYWVKNFKNNDLVKDCMSESLELTADQHIECFCQRGSSKTLHELFTSSSSLSEFRSSPMFNRVNHSNCDLIARSDRSDFFEATKLFTMDANTKSDLYGKLKPLEVSKGITDGMFFDNIAIGGESGYSNMDYSLHITPLLGSLTSEKIKEWLKNVGNVTVLKNPLSRDLCSQLDASLPKSSPSPSNIEGDEFLKFKMRLNGYVSVDSLYSQILSGQIITNCGGLTVLDILAKEPDKRLVHLSTHLKDKSYCLFNGISVIDFWKIAKGQNCDSFKDNIKSIIKREFKATCVLDKDFFFDKSGIVPVNELTFSTSQLNSLITTLDLAWISVNTNQLPNIAVKWDDSDNTEDLRYIKVYQWFSETLQRSGESDTNTAISLYNFAKKFCNPTTPVLIRLENLGLTTDSIKDTTAYPLLTENLEKGLVESDFNYITSKIKYSHLAIIAIAIQASNFCPNITKPCSELVTGSLGPILKDSQSAIDVKIASKIYLFSNKAVVEELMRKYLLTNLLQHITKKELTDRLGQWKTSKTIPNNIFGSVDYLKLRIDLDFDSSLRNFLVNDFGDYMSGALSKPSSFDSLSVPIFLDYNWFQGFSFYTSHLAIDDVSRIYGMFDMSHKIELMSLGGWIGTNDSRKLLYPNPDPITITQIIQSILVKNTNLDTAMNDTCKSIVYGYDESRLRKFNLEKLKNSFCNRLDVTLDTLISSDNAELINNVTLYSVDGICPVISNTNRIKLWRKLKSNSLDLHMFDEFYVKMDQVIGTDFEALELAEKRELFFSYPKLLGDLFYSDIINQNQVSDILSDPGVLSILETIQDFPTKICQGCNVSTTFSVLDTEANKNITKATKLDLFKRRFEKYLEEDSSSVLSWGIDESVLNGSLFCEKFKGGLQPFSTWSNLREKDWLFALNRNAYCTWLYYMNQPDSVDNLKSITLEKASKAIGNHNLSELNFWNVNMRWSTMLDSIPKTGARSTSTPNNEGDSLLNHLEEMSKFGGIKDIDNAELLTRMINSNRIPLVNNIAKGSSVKQLEILTDPNSRWILIGNDNSQLDLFKEVLKKDNFIDFLDIKPEKLSVLDSIVDRLNHTGELNDTLTSMSISHWRYKWGRVQTDNPAGFEKLLTLWNETSFDAASSVTNDTMLGIFLNPSLFKYPSIYILTLERWKWFVKIIGIHKNLDPNFISQSLQLKLSSIHTDEKYYLVLWNYESTSGFKPLHDSLELAGKWVKFMKSNIGRSETDSICQFPIIKVKDNYNLDCSSPRTNINDTTNIKSVLKGLNSIQPLTTREIEYLEELYLYEHLALFDLHRESGYVPSTTIHYLNKLKLDTTKNYLSLDDFVTVKLDNMKILIGALDDSTTVAFNYFKNVFDQAWNNSDNNVGLVVFHILTDPKVSSNEDFVNSVIKNLSIDFVNKFKGHGEFKNFGMTLFISSITTDIVFKELKLPLNFIIDYCHNTNSSKTIDIEKAKTAISRLFTLNVDPLTTRVDLVNILWGNKDMKSCENDEFIKFFLTNSALFKMTDIGTNQLTNVNALFTAPQILGLEYYTSVIKWDHMVNMATILTSLATDEPSISYLNNSALFSVLNYSDSDLMIFGKNDGQATLVNHTQLDILLDHSSISAVWNSFCKELKQRINGYSSVELDAEWIHIDKPNISSRLYLRYINYNISQLLEHSKLLDRPKLFEMIKNGMKTPTCLTKANTTLFLDWLDNNNYLDTTNPSYNDIAEISRRFVNIIIPETITPIFLKVFFEHTQMWPDNYYSEFLVKESLKRVCMGIKTVDDVSMLDTFSKGWNVGEKLLKNDPLTSSDRDLDKWFDSTMLYTILPGTSRQCTEVFEDFKTRLSGYDQNIHGGVAMILSNMGLNDQVINDPNKCILIKGLDLSSQSGEMLSKMIQHISDHNGFCAFSFYTQNSLLYFNEVNPLNRLNLFKFDSQCPSDLNFFSNLTIGSSDYATFFEQWLGSGVGLTCLLKLSQDLKDIDNITNSNGFVTWILKTKSGVDNIYQRMTLDFLKSKILDQSVQDKVILEPLVNRSIFNGIPKEFIFRQDINLIKNRDNIGSISGVGLDRVTWRLNKSISFNDHLSPFETNSLSKSNSTDIIHVVKLMLSPIDLVNPDSFCPGINDTVIGSFSWIYDSVLSFKRNKCKGKNLGITLPSDDLYKAFNRSLSVIPTREEADNVQAFFDDVIQSLKRPLTRKFPVNSLLDDYGIDFTAGTEASHFGEMKRVVKSKSRLVTDEELSWLIYSRGFWQIGLIFYLHFYDKAFDPLDQLSSSITALDLSWLCNHQNKSIEHIKNWYFVNSGVVNPYVKGMIQLGHTTCYPYELVSEVLKNMSISLLDSHIIHDNLFKSIPASRISIGELSSTACSTREFVILAYKGDHDMKNAILVSIPSFINTVDNIEPGRHGDKALVIGTVLNDLTSTSPMILTTNKFELNQVLDISNCSYEHIVMGNQTLLNALPLLNDSIILPPLDVTFEMFTRYSLMTKRLYGMINQTILQGNIISKLSDKSNFDKLVPLLNALTSTETFIGSGGCSSLNLTFPLSEANYTDYWTMFKAFLNDYYEDDDAVILYRIDNMFDTLCHHKNLSRIIPLQKSGNPVPQSHVKKLIDPKFTSCTIFKTTDRVSLWETMNDLNFTIPDFYLLFNNLPQYSKTLSDLNVGRLFRKEMFFDYSAMSENFYNVIHIDQLKDIVIRLDMNDTTFVTHLTHFLTTNSVLAMSARGPINLDTSPWFYNSSLNGIDDDWNMVNILENFKRVMAGHQETHTFPLYKLEHYYNYDTSNNVTNVPYCSIIWANNTNNSTIEFDDFMSLFIKKMNPFCYTYYELKNNNTARFVGLTEDNCKGLEFSDTFRHLAFGNTLEKWSKDPKSNKCIKKILNTGFVDDGKSFPFEYLSYLVDNFGTEISEKTVWFIFKGIYETSSEQSRKILFMLNGVSWNSTVVDITWDMTRSLLNFTDDKTSTAFDNWTIHRSNSTVKFAQNVKISNHSIVNDYFYLHSMFGDNLDKNYSLTGTVERFKELVSFQDTTKEPLVLMYFFGMGVDLTAPINTSQIRSLRSNKLSKRYLDRLIILDPNIGFLLFTYLLYNDTDIDFAGEKVAKSFHGKILRFGTDIFESDDYSGCFYRLNPSFKSKTGTIYSLTTEKFDAFDPDSIQRRVSSIFTNLEPDHLESFLNNSISSNSFNFYFISQSLVNPAVNVRLISHLTVNYIKNTWMLSSITKNDLYYVALLSILIHSTDSSVLLELDGLVNSINQFNTFVTLNTGMTIQNCSDGLKNTLMTLGGLSSVSHKPIFNTAERIGLWSSVNSTGLLEPLKTQNYTSLVGLFTKCRNVSEAEIDTNGIPFEMFLYDFNLMEHEFYKWFTRDKLQIICETLNITHESDIRLLTRYLNESKIMENRPVGTIDANSWFSANFVGFINVYDDATAILEEFKQRMNGYDEAREAYDLYTIEKRFIGVTNETLLLNSRKGPDSASFNSTCHYLFQKSNTTLTYKETKFLLVENPLCGYISYVYNPNNSLSVEQSLMNISEKYCTNYPFGSLFNAASNNSLSLARLKGTCNDAALCLITLVNKFKLNDATNFEYLYHLILKQESVFKSISNVATGILIREISMDKKNPDDQKASIKKLVRGWNETKLVNDILLQGYLDHCNVTIRACRNTMLDMIKLTNLLSEDKEIERHGIIGIDIDTFSDGRPNRIDFPRLWKEKLDEIIASRYTFDSKDAMMSLQKYLAKINYKSYQELPKNTTLKFDLLFKYYEHMHQSYYENLNTLEVTPMYFLKLNTKEHEVMLKNLVKHLYNVFNNVTLCGASGECPNLLRFTALVDLQPDARSGALDYYQKFMRKFKGLSDRSLHVTREFSKSLNIKDIPKEDWEANRIYYISLQTSNTSHLDAVWKTFVSLGYVNKSIDYEIPLIEEMFNASRSNYYYKPDLNLDHPIAHLVGTTSFSFVMWYMGENVNRYKYNAEESFSGSLLKDHNALASMPLGFFEELFRDNTNDLLKKALLDHWNIDTTRLFKTRPDVLRMVFLNSVPLRSWMICETLSLSELKDVVKGISYGVDMNKLELFISEAIKYENTTNPVRIGKLSTKNLDEKVNTVIVDEIIYGTRNEVEKDIWKRLRPFTARITYKEFSSLSRERKWDYFVNAYPENPDMYSGTSIWELVFKNNTDHKNYLDSTRYWMPLLSMCGHMKANGFKIGTSVEDHKYHTTKEHIEYTKEHYLDPKDINRDKMRDALDALELLSVISTTGVPSSDLLDSKKGQSDSYMITPCAWLSLIIMTTSIISL